MDNFKAKWPREARGPRLGQHCFWLSYPYTTYYSLITEIVSRAPRILIFAFQWLHSAYSYTVCTCVTRVFSRSIQGAGLIVLHYTSNMYKLYYCTVHMYCTLGLCTLHILCSYVLYSFLLISVQ